MIPMVLLGCSATLYSPDAGPNAPATTIADLWLGTAKPDTRVTVEAVVTSPRTAGGGRFYVQAPGGGIYSGLQVEIDDSIPEWPPRVGTPITLSGKWTDFAGGPTLWLQDRDDLTVHGEPVQPVATDFYDDPGLIWALVRATNVTVTSSVDPVGIASLDNGQRLRPDFGTRTPGYGRTGDLTGINGLALSILMRSDDDWNGDFDAEPPVESTLGELWSLTDGTPVIVRDVVQITPWSRGERYAVLQQGDVGFWIDAEGFGAPETVEGDLGTWSGELRFGDDGMRLRVWDPPEITGTGPIATWTGAPGDAVGGKLLEDTVAGLLPPGPRGDRGCDGWLLDDRFLELDDLQDGDQVRGVVRVDSLDLRRLAVLEVVPTGS